MTASELAILGGAPLRTRPFSVEPMIDAEEERLVIAALRAGNFSRFVGSASGDTKQMLRMSSAEAAEIDAEWHFLGGPDVRRFGAEFAARVETPYAVPISSATTGLAVALAAAGIGAGDEVIVPAISFSATANAVLMFNSIPVFADVDPLTFCLDVAAAEAAITPRTHAIMPVHLAGNLADMDGLRALAARHNLKLIEDAAQAIGATWGGARAGSLGDAGVFSFQQSKNIMTGEGGMIITHDGEIARRARLILNHGEALLNMDDDPDDVANVVGFNFRMPELCAALGRAQLAKLDRVNDWRTRNADVLRQELHGIAGLRLPPSQREDNGPARDVPHMFVALYDAAAMGVARHVFVAALAAEGVPVGTGYPRTMYAAPTFQRRLAYGSGGCPWACRSDSAVQYREGQCPVAERLLDEEFIWFYHIAHPSTAEDMADIGQAVRKVVVARESLQQLDADAIAAAGGRRQGRIGVTTDEASQ